MSLFNRSSRMFYFSCLIAISIIALSVCIALYKQPNTGQSVSDDESKFRKIENMAKPDEFPYHVSIQFQKKHRCSGALIGPKHVLTVAHSVHVLGSKIKDVKVVGGTFLLPGGTTCNVEAINVHPDYVHSSIRSDLAVIRLEEEVSQTDYLKPIHLPDRYRTISYEEVLVISGFNRFDELPAYTYLQKFTRRAFDKVICDERGRMFFKPWDLSGKFCAFTDTEYTTQMRDDGSPATVDRKYLVGIFTGLGQSRTGYHPSIPDFFINVSSYLDFIQEETSKI